MKRLHGWLGLPWPERWLLLRLLVALPVVAGLLRVAGYVRTRRWLDAVSRPPTARRAGDAEVQQAQRLAQLAAMTGRHGAITATCLRQALLVHWWLRCRGFAPALKIGVRKQADAFDAHAWIELQGQELGAGSLGHVAFADHGWPRQGPEVWPNASPDHFELGNFTAQS